MQAVGRLGTSTLGDNRASSNEESKLSMNMKGHILAAMREQLEAWGGLLNGLDAEQVNVARFDAGWSIKDVMAHLWAWQQLSVARLEAAADNREPVLPFWVAAAGPDWETNVSSTNDGIYAAYHKFEWSEVSRNWKDGYLRLLGVAETISEKDLLDTSRFAWMEGHSLALSLVASYDHHQEHFEKSRASLGV